MQRDAQVRACLTTKRLTVLSETIEVRPAGKDTAATRAADVVREQIDALPGGAGGVVVGALDALAMGYAIGELLWNPDGTIGRVYWHDPRRFVFHGDAFGNIEEVEVLDASMRWPASNFLIYSYGGRYGNPYGESDLVAAYRPWSQKDAALRMWLIALDRFGTPTVVGRIPTTWTQEEADKLSSQLSSAGTDTSLVVTNDVEFDDILAAGRVEPGAGYHTAVGYYDGQIARSILGQEMTTQGSSGSGGGSSFALARVHQNTQDQWIHALRIEIAETVLTSQLGRQICMMALGPDAPVPVLTFPNFTKDELAARREVIEKMITGQVIAPTEAWIRSYVGLPELGAHA